MSNDLAINPAVMINRIVVRESTPQTAGPAKAAMLHMELQLAIEQSKAENAAQNPDGEGQAPVVDSGFAVDRLI
ncbi:hypothetical protein VW29_06745 [Devosia limi DSM 17137]|uniref:Uncharacterized protein n=1 Tax=Devosia limi DSM 17137 TaxID=1121477 RepID=A0A0F5LUB9_9HYPH|nr:hypothetical protein [Devosia limi]KKB85247.1 hypothetical protein VW29_06745 [Devosia limi DSM 17137]SHF87267.1 hypothetical protein SAMN02745223_03750 [Devosia limi DSM 17137]